MKLRWRNDCYPIWTLAEDASFFFRSSLSRLLFFDSGLSGTDRLRRNGCARIQRARKPWPTLANLSLPLPTSTPTSLLTADRETRLLICLLHVTSAHLWRRGKQRSVDGKILAGIIVFIPGFIRIYGTYFFLLMTKIWTARSCKRNLSTGEVTNAFGTTAVWLLWRFCGAHPLKFDVSNAEGLICQFLNPFAFFFQAFRKKVIVIFCPVRLHFFSFSSALFPKG